MIEKESMKRKILLIILALFSTLTFSQEQKSVTDSYVEYFKLPRESLFLHTNKTTYITGEEIWFKAYAYDRKNHLPSNATTNIHVGIYDKKGNQITNKLFLARQSFAVGNLSINPDLKTGTYFIKISTNWMKNFKEKDAYIQKINIINPASQGFDTPEINRKEYDFQFLPEGGHLLAGVKNVVGIKVIDDTGKGSKCTGVVIDSKGNEIITFKSNFLGLGKFSFVPVKEETYTANITLENTKEIEQILPKAATTGITISVNNLNTSKVIINLMTNEETLQNIKQESYKLLIHKDGVAKIIPVQIANVREQINIEKELLFKGVNTITLFDSKQQPVLERMFFNEALVKKHTLSIQKKGAVGDSIKYLLKSSSLDGKSILHSSVSVLPKGTISYNPQHNIFSAFYLKPYLKGTIEKPQYYFQNQNRKKKYELDLLLLTQGWSRYEWNNIFTSPPKANYKFEDGITIIGALNNNLAKVKSLLLYPTSLNKTGFINYDEKGKFILNNFYLKSDEVLKFSIMNKRGKAKSPALVVNSLQKLEKDSIDTKDYIDFSSFYSRRNAIPMNFLTNETEVLDEIVLSSRLNRVFKKKGPPFQGKIIKINDTVAKQYVTIDQILNQQRFIVEYGLDVSIRSVEKRPVFFYLDGQIVQVMHNFLTTNTTQFEDVYIDYSYNNVLFRGQSFPESIIVNVFSRITPFEDTNLNTPLPFKTVKLKAGFEPVKKFYTPRYTVYDIKSFKDYGVIHWDPSVAIQKDKPYELTTINTGLDEIRFYIEGIASDGTLFSKVLKFDTSKKP